MPIIYKTNKAQVKITGVDPKLTTTQIAILLKEAEIKFDKVFIEIERVYETVYDCLFGRWETV